MDEKRGYLNNESNEEQREFLKKGLERYFSIKGYDAYSDIPSIINYSPRDIEIKDDSGKLIETLKGAIFPNSWSINSSNTVGTKYFRRSGIPNIERETDIRQLVKRVSGKISKWGLEQGYFSEEQAKLFEQEHAMLTLLQYGAFNSPVWFNLGLDSYGLVKIGEDNFYMGPEGKVIPVGNYHLNPQLAACFICSPEDSIESMMDVGAVTSAKIFKGGSGIGGDWSKIRSAGEPVSGGGIASGTGRFVDVQDSVARVIKSGGKTRRAATMQSLMVNHPDLDEILKHKYMAEQKARILIEAGSPGGWESHTIQDQRGQNVNISIRTDDEFFKAYEEGEQYFKKEVVSGKLIKPELASKTLEKIAFATHSCGDPGMQYHTTINNWNTCPNSGEINASNPCSEYMFLNNSACNLASLNLMKFRNLDGSFNYESFNKAIDRYIIAQDIFVSKASYPTKEIAENSHNFRPLGLGFANLGSYIMSLGLPYDSDEARSFAASITAELTGEAYLQSTELAKVLGPFNKFEENKEPFLRVLEMHRKHVKKLAAQNHNSWNLEKILETWDKTIDQAEEYGVRNSQVTLLAPTGTIGFMMGCDTTGCEPVFSHIAYKELAGGGFMKIVNETIPIALSTLGYSEKETSDILNYIEENQTIEGAPYVKEEHLPVFDCANSGKGKRFISPMGHIKMLGAVQPFLSGAISKTVNCPNDTTVEEIADLFYQGWKHGLKAVSIYRDGSKVAQPLRTKGIEQFNILKRGERESLPALRSGMTQKVKIGGIPLFLTTGEYTDGRLGELFIESLERGSDVNRLLNENAVQFSEKLQYGVPLLESLEVFGKSGRSQQISGFTDHPFIKVASGVEGFIGDWLKSHYLGDISMVPIDGNEIRPFPWELRVYQKQPKLHLIPTVAGTNFYSGVPSLEETIAKISKTNFWNNSKDKSMGLDTRKTIELIKVSREWSEKDLNQESFSGKMTGQTCPNGHLMVLDGSCWKCPICKTTTGGCGGG